MINQFFTVTEQYKEKFYQLPKVFFTNTNYLNLSNDAKIAYAILRDRLELSIKNNWIDNNDIIYFIYTNENLENILNVSKPKVIKIKKELEKAELLKQKRQGLNKPNKLYLMKPNVTECDIYQINNSETPDESSSGKEVKNINFQKSNSLTSKSKNSLLQDVNDINSNDTDISDTDISDTEFNDTHDMNDIREENIENTKPNYSNHANHLKQQSDEEALKDLELQEMPEETKGYMNNFSAKEVQIIKSVILKAKRSFNDMYDEVYMLEDMDQELLHVLKRFKGTMVKKQEPVEAMQGYLMRCILSELEEMHSMNMRRRNFENSSFNVFNH